jgi:hypothetical protein
MRYGQAEGVFVIWLDDTTTRAELHLSATEVARMHEATGQFLARIEPIQPADEPELITGEA